MQRVVDQLGRALWISADPQRIISLVPSQTELLCDLGAKARLVGVSSYCVRPHAALADVCKVGGTKKLDRQVIDRLLPDLIIANKEENSRSDIEALFPDYPVWVSDVRSLDDACQMMQQIAVMINAQAAAAELIAAIRYGFSGLPCIEPLCRAAYLIWRKPYMVAGRGTFIQEMLGYCGYVNVFAQLPDRYPQVTPELLSQAAPDEVLLSSEPFPFKPKHIEELRGILPHATFRLVDGELFSWYGSRLRFSAEYFQSLRQSTVCDE